MSYIPPPNLPPKVVKSRYFPLLVRILSDCLPSAGPLRKPAVFPLRLEEGELRGSLEQIKRGLSKLKAALAVYDPALRLIRINFTYHSVSDRVDVPFREMRVTLKPVRRSFEKKEF